jgi:hypothetical protein
LVLAPESLAAVKAARRNRLQTSLNLAMGSALATIGLTIPTVAMVSIFLDLPLSLGIGPKELTLLILSFIVAAANEATDAREWERTNNAAIYEARRKLARHANLWDPFVHRMYKVASHIEAGL